MRVIKYKESLFRLNWSIDMKKMMYILLVMVCAGAAFAQTKPAAPATPPAATPPAAAPAAPAPANTEPEREKTNAIGVDMFQLFKGFIASDSSQHFFAFDLSSSYEHFIASGFTIGANMDLYYFGFDGFSGYYFSLAAEGRYYPMSKSFEKFFVGTTLGVNILSLNGSSKPEDGGFSGLTISLKTGYKVILSKIYLEPSLSYVLSKTSMASMFGLGLPTPLGWNGGLRFGWTF
jgi:hypothetical protein